MTIKIDKPIVLIGMVGSGKSTVGKKLAKKLFVRFLDTDQVIEEMTNLSVLDIHEVLGEEYFKKKEESVVKDILTYGPVVLSTGGASFANDPVRALIKEKAISIWLHADISTILERVSRRNTRPGLNGQDKKDVLQKMMDENLPYFEQADIKIDSGNADAHFIVDSILMRLKSMNQGS